MSRFRIIATLSSAAIIIMFAALGIFSGWFTPKKFPAAIPPKPPLQVEWPEIDCANKNLTRVFAIPRDTRFQLKVRLKNMPAVENPKESFAIVFTPVPNTEDAKQKWSYGGAIMAEGRQKDGIWEFEGEANVVTFRDQRMRAILQRPGEPDLAEVLVAVEPENPN